MSTPNPPSGTEVLRCPLVPRPELQGRPVTEHLRDLAGDVAALGETGDADLLAARAGAVQATATRLACAWGQTGTARTIALAEHRTFDPHRPLLSPRGRRALDPLFALITTIAADGDVDDALAALGDLARAVRTGGRCCLAGEHLDFAGFVAQPGGVPFYLHHAVRDTGLRMLVDAGRRGQALQWARTHRGAGPGLDLARQLTILDLHERARPVASALLRDAWLSTGWERWVGLVLEAMIEGCGPTRAQTLTERFIGLPRDAPEDLPALLRVRSGWTVAELLARGGHEEHAARIVAHLLDDLAERPDGYTARASVGGDFARERAGAAITARLRTVVRDAGLLPGCHPAEVDLADAGAELLGLAGTARAALAAALLLSTGASR